MSVRTFTAGGVRLRWIQTVLMPLIVAIVGISGTFIITTYQLRNANIIAQASLESAERRARTDYQLKVLEIFSKQITSKELRERESAVRLLSSLEPDIGKKIAESIADNPQETADIRSTAQSVIEAFGYSFPLIASFKQLGQASSFADTLASSFAWQPEIHLSPSGYYGVTLGGYLSANEALKRVTLAKAKGFNDAQVGTNRQWDRDLR